MTCGGFGPTTRVCQPNLPKISIGQADNT